MFRFSDIAEIQNKNVTEKNISDGKEVSENKNDTETDYASVEDPLNMYYSASNEATLVSEIRNIINEEKFYNYTRARKNTVLIFSDEFCEEQAFPSLLPKGKVGYKAPRDIPISPARYFNQRLFNFNQYFASNE